MKKLLFVLTLFSFVSLSLNAQTSSAGNRMDWWREARFGMFIHWGVYSVPAGTYKGQKINRIGEWIMNRGKIPVAEYQQFANYQLGNIPGMAEANDYGSYKGSMSNHDQVYQNLADTLQHEKPFYADPFAGLKTVEIIERIYQAANDLTQ